MLTEYEKMSLNWKKPAHLINMMPRLIATNDIEAIKYIVERPKMLKAFTKIDIKSLYSCCIMYSISYQKVELLEYFFEHNELNNYIKEHNASLLPSMIKLCNSKEEKHALQLILNYFLDNCEKDWLMENTFTKNVYELKQLQERLILNNNRQIKEQKKLKV